MLTAIALMLLGILCGQISILRALVALSVAILLVSAATPLIRAEASWLDLLSLVANLASFQGGYLIASALSSE